jgi:hypothetical protein
MTTNHTPVVTYTITEGQLVRLCDGVQEDAIDCSVAFAAPDLLAALERITGNFSATRLIMKDAETRAMATETIEIARAAIRRAKGEA